MFQLGRFTIHNSQNFKTATFTKSKEYNGYNIYAGLELEFSAV